MHRASRFNIEIDMLASVTRLRVRSVWFLPAFLWRTFRSQRQVERSPGFFGGRLLVDTGMTFWTLTAWESEPAMKKFRGSGAHARVMTRLPKWCNEAAYAHWVATADSVPTWDEAHQRLVAEGRMSRVEHPSENHTKRLFARPRLQPLIGADMKPRGAGIANRRNETTNDTKVHEENLKAPPS